MSSHPEPLYFGDSQRSLFGWLHRPANATLATIGLLICGPLGYEAICSHRAVKYFAAAAVEHCIPTLRFDYDGTGNSAGTDLDPQRVSSWIRSIHAAIDTLKAQAGVSHVCLLGIRLGATLAAAAAAERSDVAALAALAPVVNPRSYLRELRALGLASSMHAPTDASQHPTVQETAGFILTDETRQALSAIDLTKLTRAPSQILVMDRDDLPGHDAWVAKLQSLGSTVAHQRLPGYAEMMLDAHEAQPPSKMIGIFTGWLDNLSARSATATTPMPTASLAPAPQARFSVDSAATATVLERAAFLDAEQTLFGVLTTPIEHRGDQPTPIVLLLNSGAVHHIGPNRLHVTLARRWAAELGAVVLRFDLSGLGDSAVRPGASENVVYGPHAQRDIQAAISFLRERYVGSDIHAMGLCSGAYHSFKSAVYGSPLRTVVAINPLTFAWREGSSLAFPEHRIAADVARYRSNVFQWSSWRKLFTGGVDLVEMSQVLMRSAYGRASSTVRDVLRRLRVPLRNDLGTELIGLGKRNVQLLFVFASGEPGINLLKGGGGSVIERLRRRGLLHIETIDGADHTFTARSTRARLVDILSTHVLRWTNGR